LTKEVAVRSLAAILLALGLAGCVYYPPPADPLEVSFNAAMGALQDAGLAVVTADRATGTLRGTRGNVEGIIQVSLRSDGRVGVAINARDPARSDPGLVDRLTDAYNRRMGR
jgi:hypothetical protein